MPLGNYTVKVKDPTEDAIIYDSKGYKYFIAGCIRQLCPMLCSMGASIASGFAEAESVKELGIDYVYTLKSAVEEAYERELFDDTSRILSREIFLKPFRDDVDSRLEYKNQVRN